MAAVPTGIISIRYTYTAFSMTQRPLHKPGVGVMDRKLISEQVRTDKGKNSTYEQEIVARYLLPNEEEVSDVPFRFLFVNR